jgi:hypothetical protein
VDLLHVGDVGGVEVGGGGGAELGEAVAELLVELGADGCAGSGGDGFEPGADAFVVVDFGEREVFDVGGIGALDGELAGFDFVGAALGNLGDEGLVGVGGGRGGEDGGGQRESGGNECEAGERSCHWFLRGVLWGWMHGGG